MISEYYSPSQQDKGPDSEDRNQKETIDFLGLVEDGIPQNEVQKILKTVTIENPSVTNSLRDNDKTSFRWYGNCLGQLEMDRSVAIEKGVRYRPFKVIAPYFFASSTLNVPDKKGALSAFVTAQCLAENIRINNLKEAERLIAGITERSFNLLCKYYGVERTSTEAIFDDNATMTLYQFLGLCGLKKDDTLVGFVDVGRVMPLALKGVNPEFAPANFQAAVDVWQNRASARAHIDNNGTKSGNLESLRLDIIDHFDDNVGYQSDSKLVDRIIDLFKSKNPRVFVIPTVTRSGRRLPTQKICAEIRNEQQNQGYEPIIIIDDAQGVGRLQQTEYLNDPNGFKTTGLLEHADAIFFTGAKALRALPGSSAILYRTGLLKQLSPFEDSKLLYRARRYGFFSTDANRVESYNNNSPHLVQTPELASLNSILADYQIRTEGAREKLIMLNKKIIDELIIIPGVQIITTDNIHSFSVPDIITFTLDRQNIVQQVKERLGNPDNDNEPIITLPAIFQDSKDRIYLRISMDPTRANEKEYETKIELLLKNLNKVITDLRK